MNGWIRTARATRRSGSGARATPLGCAATARLTAAARFRSRLVARFGSGFGCSFGCAATARLTAAARFRSRLVARGRSFSAPASALSVAFFASCIACPMRGRSETSTPSMAFNTASSCCSVNVIASSNGQAQHADDAAQAPAAERSSKFSPRRCRSVNLVVLLLAPTPLLAQSSVAAVGVTFVPNSYDGESFVPAAGAWETVGRGATRLHFDHMVSSPKGVFGTSQTGDPAHEITSPPRWRRKPEPLINAFPESSAYFADPRSIGGSGVFRLARAEHEEMRASSPTSIASRARVRRS